MRKLWSVSARIMIAISLVAAASCAGLAAFGLWRQNTAVDLALHRELQSDYANMIGAMESDTRAVQAVANTVANMPELKPMIRAQDRAGINALLDKTLKDIKPLGIELITIQIPPGVALTRVHNPKAFGDDVTARRKMIVQSFATKKPIGGVEAGRDVLNIFGATPIIDGETLLGTVDVGAPFGETFVNSMKSRFGVDVAIHQINDDKVQTLASTVKAATASPATLKRALTGESIFLMGTLDGQPTATTFGPLKNFSGQPVAVVEIIRNTRDYEELASNSAKWLAAGAFAAVLIAILIAAWVGRGLARPIVALQGAMRAITSGQHDVVVPGGNRRDEIGSMARAVEVFKDSLVETGRLRAAQEDQRIASEKERRSTVLALAERFETGVGGVVNAVGAASTELRNTAESMARTAEEATKQTTAVADASEEASANAQAVAAAIEELNASINEIAQQVNESAQVAGHAAQQANQTNAEVQGLALAAQKIGDVVKLISEIAAQTNLLALNATIEAARAGDAGRGFAVVASEVKALASQTSKATDEISAQVGAIQSATRTSVEAIDGITRTIGKVNEIASAIASAVEEQGAATREIAHNVSQAAKGTGEVSANIVGVRDAARETGVAADQVVSSAAELSQNGETLKAQVDAFLREVRAA
ncbi:MAG TPA: methyl-accepting chemotaxis protein [Afipia sp.]|uniref:methyl-accepting chemotaxis protein n=1 Tax=unclassified Afipia TaxID=2642050 RepID=UPI000466C2CF|nr:MULTISPECIES: methyl-accepting chemotaxis protein [unclassified Afipia]MAH69170.1 methyl-accepting chemotaxis protein [Afipia sp.]OUX61713.1 MAG: methyl-accepting chemotaxis protein [Afipia sp. TMED4]HAO38999.1 methyl-accepting chemotaxis protein [Afipia sp.]HAQ93364.1 methyl-accepting chemotaxis protein [Afipia sp.]HBF56847.1 methyl-accepting chemotaxis protein [Afipia sp.]